MKLINLATLVLLSTTVNSHAESSLTPEQQLGERLFQDQNLSLNKNQACTSCHSLQPARAASSLTKWAPGFVDPANVRSGTPVSKGSVSGLLGTLNAPSVGYAAHSPEFHWDEEEGLYIGGQFWNGRAKNLIEQAKGPFLNPVEMAMPDEAAVVERLREDPHYRRSFKDIYGLSLTAVDAKANPNAVAEIFNSAAKAIAAYEQSPVFNKFNSKFDYVLAGKTQFTDMEAKGLELFNRQDKGNCAACHTSTPTKTADGQIEPPMFTDFSYDNIGLPRNPRIPGNPEANLGLGGRDDLATHSVTEIGKHKVMSLRNIAITPPYGHNGSMATLEQTIHFYNTRDALGHVMDINSPGYGKTGWPEPEIAENLNQAELGNLGLSPEEEKAIVAFLKTLTDDYPRWGHDPRVPPGTPSPFAGRPNMGERVVEIVKRKP